VLGVRSKEVKETKESTEWLRSEALSARTGEKPEEGKDEDER
jgi:hypothetical protein